MKEFTFRYYLGNVFHAYTVFAENEASAIHEFLNRLDAPETMHGLQILRW